MSLIHDALDKARQDTNRPQIDDFLSGASGASDNRHVVRPIVALSMGIFCVMVGLVIVGITAGVFDQTVTAVEPQADQLNEMKITDPAMILQASAEGPPRIEEPQQAEAKIAPPVVNERLAADASPDAESTPRPEPSTSNEPGARTEPVSAPSAAVVALAGKTFIQSIDLPKMGSLTLNAIVWSTDRSVALVNGAPVQPGDQLQGITVVDIEKKQVKLKLDSVMFYLRMAQ